jgi:L-malate glycosyltransferase
LHILDDANLPTFKANALARAHDFDIDKIVPLYEQFYQRIIDAQLADTGNPL